jgi:hypothetical protein
MAFTEPLEEAGGSTASTIIIQAPVPAPAALPKLTVWLVRVAATVLYSTAPHTLFPALSLLGGISEYVAAFVSAVPAVCPSNPMIMSFA